MNRREITLLRQFFLGFNLPWIIELYIQLTSYDEHGVFAVLSKTVISTTTRTTKHLFVLHGRDPYICVTFGAIANTENNCFTEICSLKKHSK